MSSDTSFFGHPRGLSTLFFTEFWERFSYYGMRALLILFMTAAPSNGGLGFDVPKAGAIYGLYTSSVYMASLPGGWLADRFFGLRRAILYGGVLIAAGHFCLAVRSVSWFYFGLVLIVLGTGLLKPNVSAIVGQLYTPEDTRRDAGFSIFYMGINLGAFVAPILCGWLGQRVDWHLGFGLAGIGMTVGVIQFSIGRRYLQGAGEPPADKTDLRRPAIVTAVVLALVVLLGASGMMTVSAVGIADTAGVFLFVVVVVLLFWLLASKSWTPVERKRLRVIAVLFLASSLFWALFEQQGSTLNLFADRGTRNEILGFEFPASWLQSVNGIFIILLAPVFAWLWQRLGTREPSTVTKFSLGLLFAGLGFAILVPATMMAETGQKASVMWLVMVFLFHTIGELCLSPVGLSAMTRLAPERVAGFMMGVWFLTISTGNFVGGRVAGLYETYPLPVLCGAIAAVGVLAAGILSLLARPVSRLARQQ